MSNEQITPFGETAVKLARSPLGIIALFIFLVYGLASLVTTFGSSLTSSERLPLVWFLVIFPIIVLIVFAWLLVNHREKMIFPSDFEDEKLFIKMLEMLETVAPLVNKSLPLPDESPSPTEEDIETSESTPHITTKQSNLRRNQILWVDDRPNNNVYERKAFEAVGLHFTLALSTNEAIQHLANNQYVAIISDMGRREGPREGYVLLDAIRKQGNQTPFFIYSSSNAPEHKREAHQRGAQGATNHSRELFQMVMGTISNH